MKKIILLLLVLLMIPVQVFAANPREIPYAHALSRAISRDAVIVPMDREIRQANARARDLLNEYLELVNFDRPVAEAIYGQRKVALAERDRLTRERERLKLTIERQLRTHLANIAHHEAIIAINEINLDLQERALEQTGLRHYHGMASTLELNEARLLIEQTRLNLETSILALQNERQQLNRLIHQPITANIRVIYDIHDIEPMPEGAGTERFIERQAALDHNLLYWREETEIRRYEWQRQLDDPDVDNRYMRLQHQLATLERDMALRQAELNVRNAFAEWERLIEAGTALEAALAQAIADYEDMQIRLEAGLVTQIAVDTAANGVAAAEALLARHEYDFWIARIRIAHPYLR